MSDSLLPKKIVSRRTMEHPGNNVPSLEEVFERAPSFMAVARGPDFIVEYANNAYLEMVDFRNCIGKPTFEVFPELKEQGIDTIMRRVLKDGTPFIAREMSAFFRNPESGENKLHYLDFIYYPIKATGTSPAGVVLQGSDVTAHVLARRQLEEAREQVERANRAKGYFLSNMSHELHTPINAIIGYANLMQLGITGPIAEPQAKQLEKIISSSKHLLMLIEDILTVANEDTGGFDLQNRSVNASVTVREALIVVQLEADRRSVKIENLCIRDKDTCYYGDENRVIQILVNLISNSIKFTEENGSVYIKCGIAEKHNVMHTAGNKDQNGNMFSYISVSDTGIGIPFSELDNIFKPFEQLEKGHTRTVGGPGLGLTVSRNFAKLMGGDITVDSVVSQGSTFTLWLPVCGEFKVAVSK